MLLHLYCKLKVHINDDDSFVVEVLEVATYRKWHCWVCFADGKSSCIRVYNIEHFVENGGLGPLANRCRESRLLYNHKT